MSAVLAPPRRSTEEEYFAFEETSVTKHEFYQGEIFEMPGCTFAHERLVAKLLAIFDNRLAAGPCQPTSSNLKVKVEATGLIAYPDVAVTCDPPRMVVQQGRALANPTALFEVLSESTEAYDRGGKFAQYRQIPSLRAYGLVSQWEPMVEMFAWEPGGPIVMHEAKGLEAELEIAALGIRLPLTDLYRGVVLPPRSTVLPPDWEERGVVG